MRAVLESTTLDTAVAKLQEATSVLDKVTSRGIIHKNNAAHKKSMLAKYVNKLKFGQASA
mgnify:CR=1 FL=1